MEKDLLLFDEAEGTTEEVKPEEEAKPEGEATKEEEGAPEKEDSDGE